MAEHLGVAATLMSAILAGRKPLTLEHAINLSDHLGFIELEKEYFVTMVERDRAGHHWLRRRSEAALAEIKKRHEQLGQRLKKDRVLELELKTIYYSDWIYGGVRNLTSINGTQTVEDLAAHLQLPVDYISRVVGFLVEKGLCVIESGRLSVGPSTIYLPKQDPMVTRQHQNWRHRAADKMPLKRDGDLFFTSPVTLSIEDREVVRRELMDAIEKIMRRIAPSPPEVGCCLNVDWFQF
jgi:plasmid maintenance system antidote protein VapI